MINKLLSLLNPRWRKVVRDIMENKARTALVVLAIAVGVFAFGGMFITRAVFLAELNTEFEKSNPSTMIIISSDFSEGLARSVRTFPEVESTQPVATLSIKVQTNNPNPTVPEWVNIDLNALPNYDTMIINQITPELGTFPPQRREIVVERTSFPILGVEIGDEVTVELPDGTQRELVVAGTVHDFQATPAHLFPQLTAYTTLDTLVMLGHGGQFNQLNVRTTPEYDTEEELREVADSMTEELERAGYFVGFIQTNLPGEHWSNDIVGGFVTALGLVGALALALSGFLVINTLTAILSQQKRQIGMMKAIGAQLPDVMGIYLVMAAVFGVLALVIALPIGIALAYGLTRVLAWVVNVDINQFNPPLWIIGLQVVVAVLTPLVAAMIPIIGGTRVTVREAVSDYGISGVARQGLIDRALAGIRGLPRPTMLSLRNTFRRKGRLFLTVATLVIAGAIFMSVLNVRNSLLIELKSITTLFNYDIQMMLGDAYPMASVRREAARVDGITKVEGWGLAVASRNRGDDLESETFITFAPPADTTFVQPTMIEGRWLQPGDTNAIVISSELALDDPAFQVGEEVSIDFGTTKRDMLVIGIMNLPGVPFAYADFDYITRLQQSPGRAMAVAVGTDQRDEAFVNEVGRNLEERFKRAGIVIQQTQSIGSLIGSIVQQVNIFVIIMLFMAVLLAIVGGLGLASTMSLNVLERTREIGVMRAIGAADGSVRSIFLTEGELIGLMSWFFAVLLSVPVSWGFDVFIGNAFFDRPLTFSIEPWSVISWLVIALGIAAVSSLVPSNRAAQVSVRESLSYE